MPSVSGVEDEAGNALGQATALDAIANISRVRRKPEPAAELAERTGPNLIEIAHAQYQGGVGAGNAVDDAGTRNPAGTRNAADTRNAAKKGA